MLTGLLTSEDWAKVAIRACVSRVPMVRCRTVDDLLNVKWKNKHATGAIGTNVGYTVKVDEPLIRQIHAIIILQIRIKSVDGTIRTPPGRVLVYWTYVESSRKPRRQCYQTKGLRRSTTAVCYILLYISLPSPAQQQRKMTKFCIF